MENIVWENQYVSHASNVISYFISCLQNLLFMFSKPGLQNMVF